MVFTLSEPWENLPSNDYQGECESCLENHNYDDNYNYPQAEHKIGDRKLCDRCYNSLPCCLDCKTPVLHKLDLTGGLCDICFENKYG